MVNRISSPNPALTTPSITGEERSISNGCISEAHRTLRGAFIKGVLSAELTSDRNTTLSFGIINLFLSSTRLCCLTFDPNRRVSFSDRSRYLGTKLRLDRSARAQHVLIYYEGDGELCHAVLSVVPILQFCCSSGSPLLLTWQPQGTCSSSPDYMCVLCVCLYISTWFVVVFCMPHVGRADWLIDWLID